MPVSTSFAVKRPVSLLLMGADPTFHALAVEAGSVAFGDAHIQKLSEITTPQASAGNAPLAVLLLCDPDAPLLQQALEALDETRLPRWAVVVFGTMPAGAFSGTELISRDEWSVPQIARLLRLAARQHALVRENTRLRYDFLTYGHRVAHDLRTPLGGVLTTTEVLREILADEAPESLALTQPILDSAEGLVKLIDRVSQFAKATSGDEPAAMVKMETVFWNAYQKLEAQILKAGATLKFPQEWPTFHARPTAMESVWRHLITNSLEHGGPAVRIEAGWNEVAEGHRFWLTDTGRVAADKRATLFFPFHRLHEHGAPRGLGLPMAQRLVELEGGSIGFEEMPDGTSRFYFVLPKRGA